MPTAVSPPSYDPTGPVEIAERIWWVGHLLPGDPFQCHVYLIENGDQSVLIDPGSNLNFPHTLKKIERVIPFRQIRYFICHHQDPDITAALPQIDAMVEREDALVVTHGRAQLLLKHYGLRMGFWNVEEHEWRLDLGGRELQFIFTPYAHFPGAFCTFDSRSGTLFSSDLFGGLSDQPELFARDESYFDDLRPFHEHYMPSREILQYALAQVRDLPLERIAPQHGSIIPKALIGPLMQQLAGLDCGLYLLTREHANLRRLSELNQVLRDMTRAMMTHRDFNQTIDQLTGLLARLLPVRKLVFFVGVGGYEVYKLAPENRYRGESVKVPKTIQEVFGVFRHEWLQHHPRGFTLLTGPVDPACEHCQGLLAPLFAPENGRAQAVAIICLDEPLHGDDEMAAILEQMSEPLEVALEREAFARMLELRRQELYERAVRDPLTGLFTRYYMEDVVGRLFAIGERNETTTVGIIVLDIDQFKQINDSYGHVQGDRVLQEIAGLMLEHVRRGDLAVRLGGDEFAVFLANNHLEGVLDFAERLRADVAALAQAELAELSVSVSLGVAMHRHGEELQAFLARADTAMYQAKAEGRNRICLAES